MKNSLVAVCFAVASPFLHADQGGLVSSAGGTLAAIGIANPAGTLSIVPPNLTFTSSDGSTFINATFSSNKTVEFCSGGGKGGRISCSFTFTGSFSGTLTVNGSAQAINGTTTQYYSSTGAIFAGGVTGYNSAYTPFYFTDGNARILRSDDLSGTNAIAYGTQGSGVGQFYGPSGIALDASGRIYITDTYNDRIVRIDDMNGTNWSSFGTYGPGVGQFMIPQSISIDPAGHIWVLDNGNGRLVRMDDMNGANWTVVATAGGSGVGQFAGLGSAPGFDSLGRIYVADSGNGWIARFDDVNFTNWTTTPALGAVTGVVVDPAGKIYAADSTPASVIRVDDMTGANRISISLGTFGAHTIAIDSTGMVLLGNGYEAQIDDSQATILTSTIDGNLLVDGVYANVYGAVPIPLPSPRPSAIGFAPNTLTFSQNIGTASAAQTVTINNFGGSPLTGLAISATGAFSQTDNCPPTLPAGSNCTVSVTFIPAATGAVTGALNISDNSGNAGSVQTLVLNGTGTAPAAVVSPTSLSFSSQVIGTSSTARNITLQSTGTGPLQVSAITASGPFSQTNTCATPVAAGSSCTISVMFSPTLVGNATGNISITDNAGTQTVSLTGNGSAPVTLSSSSLSFGSLAVGNTSAAKSVTITNRTSAAVSFSSIGTSGPFAVASNTCPASLAAGANCAVGVTFTPAAIGAASGTLTLVDSALNSPQTVALSGTGTAPVTLSTGSLSFSTTAVGSTSSTKTVTLTNRQSAVLTFSGITTSGPFGIASNTCGTSIAAGATCSVGVTFTPTATGSASGTLTFADNAPSSPQSVTLSGTGGSTSSPVTLSASTLSFGTVTLGSTSSTMTVTLTNRQTASLAFSGIGITGAFAVATNTCGTGIAAGASCAVGVTFTPTATGAATGTLTFTDGASNSPQRVNLTGTGSAPFTLSSGTLSFGVVPVGATSAAQAVTVTNASSSAVAVNSVTITGDFAETTTCTASLATGASCTISVTFTPSLGGTRTGVLTVNLSTGVQNVSLTGAGSSSSLVGRLSLSGSVVSFNNGYTIGDNPSQNVIVTNLSAGPAGIAGISMIGDPSLTQSNNCGASLAAGATCTIRITFRPVAYGTFTGTLTVTESSGALDTVSVTGVSTVNN